MELEIRQGESRTYNLTVRDPDGAPWFLQEGERLRLGVKRHHSDRTLLLKKELGAAELKNGVYPFRFTPEDTRALEPGSYVYDVGVQSGEDYYYIIGSARELPEFVVLPSVTKWEAPNGT